jgi:hypothetical protein
MRLEVHFANGTAFRTSPIAEIRVFDVGDYRGQYKVVDARASLVRSL